MADLHRFRRGSCYKGKIALRLLRSRILATRPRELLIAADNQAAGRGL